ncbi:MAG: universal stress protein [Pseudomonadota bacterium]|nr:universal stress protein [Pseudomonadota bacterium]
MTTSSYRILLVMGTTHWSHALTEHAIAEAVAADARGATVELDVLYIIEQDDLDRVYRSVGESGFLGTRPQAEITSLLLQEHLRVAAKRIEEARRAVEERGYKTTERHVTGHYEAEVRAAASTGQYDVIFLSRSDKTFLSRFFFGSEADRVARWVREEGYGKVVVEDTEG